MLERLSDNGCFGGVHRRYRHHSRALDCAVELAVFPPPAALAGERAPAHLDHHARALLS